MELEPEIVEIEKFLLQDKIGWEEALRSIVEFRKKNKPWKSKGWERQRQALLGEHCEQCGSVTPPLVLQHFWHPRSFSQIFRSLSGDIWKAFKAKHAEALAEDLKEEGETCPHCGSGNIKYQKKKGDWRCQTCQHTFLSPVKRKVLTREARRILSTRKRDGYEHRWKAFQQKYGSEFGKQAVLIGIEEGRRYLSMKDAATFCQRCAYLWDKQGLRLCARCGRNYHVCLYEVCEECSKGIKHGI